MSVDWAAVTLGEVCTVIAGQSPAGSSFNARGQGLPFYQGKKDFTVRHLGPPTVWTTEITKEAMAGDILMSVRAPVGPINYATQRICIGRGLAAIRPTGINPDFLFYCLLSKQSEIAGREGAVFASISRDEIKRIIIPLPPRAEQQRIVDMLDEAFNGIDAAAATTIAARSLIEALGARAASSMFETAAQTWGAKALAEIADVSMGQSPPGTSYNTHGDGVPLINGPDEFGGTDAFSATVASKFTTMPTKLCRTGDAIICVRGSTTGRMNIAGHDACIGRGVASVRAKTDQAWINQFLKFSRPVIFAMGSGATFPNVSGDQLRSLRVPTPPDAKKAELVQKLAQSDEALGTLTRLYSAKLAALSELKQSVLARAFSGELTREPLAA